MAPRLPWGKKPLQPYGARQRRCQAQPVDGRARHLLAIAIDGANRHDMQLAKPTLESPEVERPCLLTVWLQGLSLEKRYDYPQSLHLVSLKCGEIAERHHVIYDRIDVDTYLVEDPV